MALQEQHIAAVERALTVFATVVVSTAKFPVPKDFPLTRIKDVCFTYCGTVDVGPVPGKGRRAAKAEPASKRKRGRAQDAGTAASSSKERQRQVAMSHTMLMALSQHVVTLVDEEGEEEGPTEVDGGQSALPRSALRLLVERQFLLVLSYLGGVIQGQSSTAHKLQAFRCLEVRPPARHTTPLAVVPHPPTPVLPQRLLAYPQNNLEGFVPPILVLLRPALLDRTLIVSACRVWRCMVEALTQACLVQYLVPMVASLLSVFPSEDDVESSKDRSHLDPADPEDEALLLHVLSVLRVLLEVRYDDVKEHLAELPSLPKCSLLADLQEVRVRVRLCGCPVREPRRQPAQKLAQHNTNRTLVSELTKAIALLSHDTLAVQQMAVVQIERLVVANCSQVYTSFLDATAGVQLREVLTEVIRVLLELTLRSRATPLWLRIARCLGQLGAVDPSRVNVVVRVKQVRPMPASPSPPVCPCV